MSTDEDTAYTFDAADFGFMSLKSGATLGRVKITALPGPNYGTLSLDGTAITSVTTPKQVTKTMLDAGKLAYTPPANANGAGFATFDFKVNDGVADSEAAYTITIDVNAVNDPLTGSDKTVSTDEDTAYIFDADNFGFSDVDAGATLNHVKITSLPGLNQGTLSLNGPAIASVSPPQQVTKAELDAGKLTYTPPANANGATFATFDFKVSDGTDDSDDEYTITIDVNAVNDPPVATADTAETSKDIPIVIGVLENDSDVDAGTTLRVVEVGFPTAPNNGTAAINPYETTVTYSPNANVTGTDTFSYAVTDGFATVSVPVTVTIRQNGSNANLSNLSISSGTLTPEFAATTISYAVAVEATTASVTPTTAEGNATVTVNGTAVASGSASGDIDLIEGDTTTIEVIVTAADRVTIKAYTITVRETLSRTETPEQFSQTLEGMLAVTARSMGESAQTAIEGRFEQYRQWSQEVAGESVPTTSQPWRENSPTTLSPEESERIVGEGAGGKGAEGSLVQSHWGTANSSTAMGAGWKSENRETGTSGSRLRSLSLGSLGNVAHSYRKHSGASPGSSMEPSGSVYGQDRHYSSGVVDAPPGPGSRDMSGMRVEELRLSEISFEMSLGDSEKETSWVPVLWGQGDLQYFKGNLARFGMDYQGDLEAAHVGLDLYANNQMLGGLSFMRSLGDMEYTDDGIDGVLESRMHTVHPYLYWQPTERLSVWGIGGLGTGQVEVREPGRTHDFDTNFRMFAAGVRAVLTRRGNNEWGLRADAFTAQLETDALEDIAKVSGEAHRGRLMLEWVHNRALSAGRSLSVQMEAGGRFDGGDADRGIGAETGVRLGYLDANSGLDVALHGRLLVVHESDYQDWGVGVQASWDPGEKQRGLRASVMSSWGQDEGGQMTLWDNADAVMHPAGMGALGTSSQYRMEIDVAYGDGMKSLGLPGLLTPYSRLRWTGQGRELSLGTEWSLPTRSRQSLPSTLEFEVTRQENRTGPADLEVLARMSISF